MDVQSSASTVLHFTPSLVCTTSHRGHSLVSCGKWDVKMDFLDPDACLESLLLPLGHNSRYCHEIKQLRADWTLAIPTQNAQLCSDYFSTGCTLMGFCLADLQKGKYKKTCLNLVILMSIVWLLEKALSQKMFLFYESFSTSEVT